VCSMHEKKLPPPKRIASYIPRLKVPAQIETYIYIGLYLGGGLQHRLGASLLFLFSFPLPNAQHRKKAIVRWFLYDCF
jgi:hypothetical protein